MGIVYPAQYAEEWYATWRSMMSMVDGHHFAAFEDRNLFVMGGGTWSFNSTTGEVSWSSSLVLATPSTGNPQTLSSGSKVLQDGEMLTVDVSRGASAPASLAAAVESTIAPGESTVALCIRYGSALYFRNGSVLGAGSSAAVFSGSTAAPVERCDVFTATSGQTTFTMSVAPASTSVPMVIRGGVVMAPGSLNDYQVVSGSVVFNYGVPLSQVVQVRYTT
jgi:hypothetical protein